MRDADRQESDRQKQAAAEAALAHVPEGATIGVGSGSTVAHFIDALARRRVPLSGVVAASEASAARLRTHGIPLIDLNSVDSLTLCIDGADEINLQLQAIKGGGAALTREKIVAAVAGHFICIADAGKSVRVLGHFPLPVEVIPMARSHVARQMVRLGGRPVHRLGVRTDNGNEILDVYGLSIAEPSKLEGEINQIPGVVCNGLFARRRFDRLILGTAEGVVERLAETSR